jgi:hypothetical protein
MKVTFSRRDWSDHFESSRYLCRRSRIWKSDRNKSNSDRDKTASDRDKTKSDRDKTASDRDKPKSDRRSEEEKRRPQFFCNVCHKEFDSAGDLQDHLTEPEHSRMMLRMKNGKSLFAVNVKST